MNSFLITSFVFFNFTKILKYLAIFFLGMLLIPIFTVVLLTNTGIATVSNHLAKVNVANHGVTLYYPNGLLYKNLQLDTTWPITGVVTLEFGQSDLPYQPLHTGIDIANKLGTPVIAATSGTVTYAGEINWGYGKHVIVDNGNNLQTLYGHLSEIDVKKGDTITVGETSIGKVGQTGWATGPHLHLEFDLWGVPINPRTVISGNP